MNATILVKKINPNAPYYVVKDHDERLGGDVWWFVTPIIATGNQPVYFVGKEPDGRFSLSGEGYIVDNADSLRKHKEEAKRRLGDKKVRYKWDDAYFTPILVDLDDEGLRKKLFVLDQYKMEERWSEMTKARLQQLEWSKRYTTCYHAREAGIVVYEEEREVQKEC